MQLFLRNCTHLLTRTQGEKFEYMFLVKIASKRTSLRRNLNFQSMCNSYMVVAQKIFRILKLTQITWSFIGHVRQP